MHAVHGEQGAQPCNSPARLHLEVPRSRLPAAAVLKIRCSKADKGRASGSDMQVRDRLLAKCGSRSTLSACQRSSWLSRRPPRRMCSSAACRRRKAARHQPPCRLTGFLNDSDFDEPFFDSCLRCNQLLRPERLRMATPGMRPLNLRRESRQGCA